MEAAIAVMGSDMGSLQRFDPERDELQLIVWRGFHPRAAEFWQTVNVNFRGTCARALSLGRRAIVPDVETCEFMAGSDDLEMFHLSGIRAVQTTPLVSRGGQLVGMISTHWREPHEPSELELGRLDVLARQAADLVERCRVQIARRESEERLQAVADLVPDLLWESEADGSTNWYNRRWVEYTGQTFGQAIGWGWIEAIHPHDRAASARRYGEAVETGRPLRQEHRIRRHDGEYRWFVVNALPFKDDGGRVVKVYGAATDIHEARVALEALRESERKYRSLFDSIDEGFIIAEVIYDGSGRATDVLHLEVNPAALRLTGLPDYSGRRLKEISPHFEPYWLEIYDRVARTGVGERDELYAAPLGRWYDFYVFPAGDGADSGDNGRVAVIFRDISDRKRAEAALRESEEKYRRLFNSIDEGFCTVEVLFDGEGRPFDHRILTANPSFERHSGIADPEGKTAGELRPGAEPVWNDLYAQVIATGRPVRREIRSHLLDRWLEVFVSRVGEASLRQVAVLFADISDRKRAEATIAADLRDTRLLQELSLRFTSEEDIQVLYGEIVDAAIALSRADAGSLQCRDFDADELQLLATRGLSRELVEHCDRVAASSQTSCGRALIEGRRAFVDFDAPEDPDGSLKMHLDAGLISAQSTPLISRSGRFIGMLSTHWRRRHRPDDRELRFLDLLARQAADLIEQRQATAERQRLLKRERAAREEAERANRIKDEFLAILSHELRSPLNPILGWAKLLQSRPPDAATLRRALETIERNAKLQTQLIDDLLDIARVLRGKLKLEETAVDLAAVIEAAMEVVRTAAEAKSIDLRFERADFCRVRGDAGRLQQVVWNLLSNAVKFTPEGGSVGVSLERCERRARIVVTDTGKGIGPDFLPHVFQFFRQEDSSITRHHGGLGLGLAIVKYLADAHGGTVTAESPGEGLGATFSVEFPLLPSAPAAPPAASPPTEADLSGIKILAVDDGQDTRELLTAFLSLYGAEIRVAASGAEVLANFGDFDPDVLICDIGMPDMDGYALLRQIRDRPDNRGGNIPAIAVTAFARSEDRRLALERGFQHHIAKPIEWDELLGAIGRLVGR